MGKIIELFCGTKSISSVFDRKGWQTITFDIDGKFEPTYKVDVDSLEIEWFLENFKDIDVIWASPPCTTFSVASVGRHWDVNRNPKTQACIKGLSLLCKTVNIINALQPKFWFIENPRGMMRTLPMMQEFSRYTITYCQYGDFRMKPTDIWTNHPNPQFKPACKNGDPCHESAPRGSKSGTQRIIGAMDRGRIPELFCEHVFNICNN